jgi:hypothetical protein
MKTVRADSKSLITTLAAVLTAAVLGYLYLHNDEVQLPLLLLLLSTFLLGFVRPRHAWVWVIIIGLGVPSPPSSP